MTVYYYENSPVIDKVSIVHSAGSRYTAYLHAREDADGHQLDRVKDILTNASMECIPVTHDGEYALEVRNIGLNGKNVLALLRANNLIAGTPRAALNAEAKVSTWDRIKANTLRLSGALYSVGDLFFLGYGWKDSITKSGPVPSAWNLKWKGQRYNIDPPSLLAGVFYALGTPALTIFGTGDKSDIQLRHLSFEARKHLEGAGIKIPQYSSILSVTHKHNSTLGKKVLDKLNRYPAEICNAIYGIAAACMIWGGVNTIRGAGFGNMNFARKLPAFVDIGLGVSTISAALISFVPESARRPGEPKKTGLAGFWQWVQEKPLRAAGYLLAASTVGHATSTGIGFVEASKVVKRGRPAAGASSAAVKEYEDAEKTRGALPFRALFVATNLAAELAMSTASKGHGEGVISDISLEPSTYAVMADLILLSPKDQRGKLLDQISEYLARRENLNLDKDKIRDAIRLQMQDTKGNPWLGVKYEKQESLLDEAATEGTHKGHTSILEPAASATAAKKWQDSVSKETAAISSPIPGV